MRMINKHINKRSKNEIRLRNVDEDYITRGLETSGV